MECYACDQEATERCSRCANAYCKDHGGEGGLCASCLDPVNAAPSSVVFRTALFGLLGASVLALWLLVRPPDVPGESSGAIRPLPTAGPSASPQLSPSPLGSPSAEETPAATPEPTPETTEPPPEGPIEYTVVDGDTWYGIADAFGVDAERLAAYNGYTLDDFVRPGQVLEIPQ